MFNYPTFKAVVPPSIADMLAAQAEIKELNEELIEANELFRKRNKMLQGIIDRIKRDIGDE